MRAGLSVRRVARSSMPGAGGRVAPASLARTTTLPRPDPLAALGTTKPRAAVCSLPLPLGSSSRATSTPLISAVTSIRALASAGSRPTALTRARATAFSPTCSTSGASRSRNRMAGGSGAPSPTRWTGMPAAAANLQAAARSGPAFCRPSVNSMMAPGGGCWLQSSITASPSAVRLPVACHSAQGPGTPCAGVYSRARRLSPALKNFNGPLADSLVAKSPPPAWRRPRPTSSLLAGLSISPSPFSRSLEASSGRLSVRPMLRD